MNFFRTSALLLLTLTQAHAIYTADQVGEDCVGGTSGNSGTVQECISMPGEYCCQTMAQVQPDEEIMYAPTKQKTKKHVGHLRA